MRRWVVLVLMAVGCDALPVQWADSAEPRVIWAPGTPGVPEADGPKLPVFPGYDQEWHQSHDALIVEEVLAFNAQYGWDEDHEHYLDPVVVKAWALQESGGHPEIFVSGDMMQVNNDGDWAPAKVWVANLSFQQQVTPRESLRAALRWAYYKGELTRPRGPGNEVSEGWYPTVREAGQVGSHESCFGGWERALAGYNGGGVPDYLGDIERRMTTVAMR